MATLPIPSAQQQALSQQLSVLIQQKIKNNQGWISFADFMNMALYTPGLGYYSGGAQKFGHGGDFVTAPEISPLFAKTLALQAAQILAATQGDILELGAGTGKLAADLLLELQTLDSLPTQYLILEVSDHLRQIQLENLQKRLPADLFKRVLWLETLPPSPQPSPTRGEGVQGFVGLILANEVLDAIPAHIVHKTPAGWLERGVGFADDFVWRDAPLSAPNLAEHLPDDLAIDYVTEVNPAASALVCSLIEILEKGVILLLDYGFGAAEYYHPQRNQGTLMCHYQHYAHSNPLINVGLQDITAHVNFTQIAMLCEPHGIRLAGYVNQAQFLINCGILDVLSQTSPNDMAAYAPLAAAAQKLLSPAEMGDLFKVIGFTKNMDEALIGFKSGDKSHAL
jgi:SAM-dependent MidA family methyltransferase